MELKRLSTEELRNLCVKNDWFTCGSNSQYEYLFDMNRYEEPSVRELARIIRVCSNGNNTLEEIEEILTDAMTPVYYELTCKGNGIESMVNISPDELDMIYNAVCRLNQDIDCCGCTDYSEDGEEACKSAEKKIFQLMTTWNR